MSKKTDKTVEDMHLDQVPAASAVTTGLKDDDLVGADGTAKIDLGQATITVPQSAIEHSAAPKADDAADAEEDQSFAARALRAGIGKIDMLGINWSFVGAREKGQTTPDGNPVTGSNSTFTPLSEVRFDPSVRCYVDGEYIFPTEATSWEGVEGLVPAAKKSSKK